LPTDGDFGDEGRGAWGVGREFGGAGLLVKVIYDDEGQVADVQWERDFNILREEIFQHPWSIESEESIIDLRDEIHKQGWAFIRVTGQIGGTSVSGAGRIPLVAGMAGEYWPWLRLELGGQPAASSFAGLGRPWLGLHTIDVVRRDAKQAGMEFSEPREIDSHRVEITVSHRGEVVRQKAEGKRQKREEGSGYPVKLVYTINMEKDWVEKIEFYRPGGEKEGEMNFSYSQESTGAPQGAASKGRGMEWLMEMAERMKPEG